jgi:lipid-A-disaccharide synthase-like uncharacterized protein
MNFLAHWYLMALHNPYDTLWNVVGFGGQGVFTARMLLQWLKSEQEGHSVVPAAFWYCSFLGGLTLFLYAVHLQAWPLVLGQGFPLPIYARNIWMIHRDQRNASAAT